MPWFKVDDTLAFHHKSVAAGNAAMGLWVRAGSWSMQTLSDGFVPDVLVSQLGSTSQAARLVSVGLWDRLPEGFAFHEWEQRQPTKAQVTADREATAERQRKARERRKKDGE
jgi:hypothetical protein